MKYIINIKRRDKALPCLNNRCNTSICFHKKNNTPICFHKKNNTPICFHKRDKAVPCLYNILAILILFAFVSCQADVTYVEDNSPKITKVTPNVISAKGETIEIEGKNFTYNVKVYINKKEIPVESLGATKLVVKTPVLNAGKTEILLQNADFTTTVYKDFEITPLNMTFSKLPDFYIPEIELNNVTFAVFDIDGDNDSDVLFNDINKNVSVLFNDKNGFFSLNEEKKTALFPEINLNMNVNKILTFDFGNNQKSDILFCNKDSDSVLLIHDGEKYVQSIDVLTIDFQCVNVFSKDVNNDNNADLIFTGLKEEKYFLFVFVNNNGKFEQLGENIELSGIPNNVQFNDVNNDEINDFIMSYNNKVEVAVDEGENKYKYINNFIPFQSTSIASLCINDFDNDFDNDIVILSQNGQDEMLINDGFGYFFNTTYSSMPYDYSKGADIICKDIDIDGFVDIVIANDGFVNRLYKNNQKGGFYDITPSLDTKISQSTFVTLNDIDNDKDDDIIFYDKQNGLQIYLLTDEK